MTFQTLEVPQVPFVSGARKPPEALGIPEGHKVPVVFAFPQVPLAFERHTALGVHKDHWDPLVFVTHRCPVVHVVPEGFACHLNPTAAAGLAGLPSTFALEVHCVLIAHQALGILVGCLVAFDLVIHAGPAGPSAAAAPMVVAARSCPVDCRTSFADTAGVPEIHMLPGALCFDLRDLPAFAAGLDIVPSDLESGTGLDVDPCRAP